MRVKASVGRVSKSADLRKRAHSLSLTAQTADEQQFLSSLYRLIMKDGYEFQDLCILRSEYDLHITRKD